jgi:ElaA protein
MLWKCCDFAQLNGQELYQILRSRNAVLIVEDANLHLDIDGKDATALHVFAVDETDGATVIVAYARLRPADDVDPEVAIDKELTLTSHRDNETSRHLLEYALEAAHERWPGVPVRTHSPVHREPFYKRLGFRKVDGPFLEHGMPFIGMVRSHHTAPQPLRHSRRTQAASPEFSDA